MGHITREDNAVCPLACIESCFRAQSQTLPLTVSWCLEKNYEKSIMLLESNCTVLPTNSLQTDGPATLRGVSRRVPFLDSTRTCVLIPSLLWARQVFFFVGQTCSLNTKKKMSMLNQRMFSLSSILYILIFVISWPEILPGFSHYEVYRLALTDADLALTSMPPNVGESKKVRKGESELNFFIL